MSFIRSEGRDISCESRTHPDSAAAAVRDEQGEHWAQVAADWVHFDPHARPLTDRLIARVHLQGGSRVIDLACGTGMPALAAAEIVGPRGFVLGLDLVPEMIVIARSEAARRALTNVEFRTIQSEDNIDVGTGSFHAATCKHGLMWMPRPLSGLRALHRALTPGGRIAVSSWQDIALDPILSIVPEVARKHLRMPADWPAQPPTPLGSADSLEAILREAGFIDVRSEFVPLGWEAAPSAEEFVSDALLEDECLADALDDAEPETRADVQREIERRVKGRFPSGPVVVRLQTIVAAGHKPYVR